MDPKDIIAGEHLAELAAHIDAAKHGFLTELRTFDESGEWARQGFRTCSQWMSWRLGWDVHTSREYIRTASALAKLPAIDDAFRRGQVSYSKVRAMTRIATPENEATILDQARYTTASQLVSICRKYEMVLREGRPKPDEDVERRRVTRRDHDDGMVEIRAILHSDEAEVVWAALDRIAKEHCGGAVAAASPAPTSSAPSEASRAPTSVTESPAAAPVTDSPTSELDALIAAYTWSPRTDPNYVTVPESLYLEDERTERESRPTSVTMPLHRAFPTKASRRAARVERQTSFDRASALVTMAESVVRGDAPHRSPTEVMVTVPLETLRASGAPDVTAVATSRNGACLSAETVRRMCCDAGMVPVLEDDKGRPLSVGRKTRTIPPSVMRVLLKRDRTCTFPGCNTRVFLQGHHLQHWADGGKTSVDNLCLLCSHHHRFVHEYGYTVEMTDEGPLYRQPGGAAVPQVPKASELPDLGWPSLFERNADLDITTETIACGYDGSRVSYADCIHVLARADGL